MRSLTCTLNIVKLLINLHDKATIFKSETLMLYLFLIHQGVKCAGCCLLEMIMIEAINFRAILFFSNF